MRILWVKMGGLWPLNTGGKQRSFQILSELSRRHEVAVITTVGIDDQPDGLTSALHRCSVELFPHQVPKQGSASFAGALARSWFSRYPVDLWKWRAPAVRRRVRQRISGGHFDVVVVDFLYAVANVPAGGSVPTVFFAHNVEHLIWRRLADVEPIPWRRAVLAVEWRKVQRCEARACHQASLTIAVSDDDRTRLQQCARSAHVTSIATGVDAEYFRPEPGREVPDALVFSGSMDWYPNEDAVHYFVETILPRIRQRRPGVSFTIVGRNPTRRILDLAARPGVRVTGTLADVRPSIASGAVYVVPLRVGGGTRLKIFEAMAMGKAVVSTAIGAEGLELSPDRHILLADDPDTFATSVVGLLEEPSRRQAMGANARQLVEERYSWRHVARQFEGHLMEATKHDVRLPVEARRAPVS